MPLNLPVMTINAYGNAVAIVPCVTSINVQRRTIPSTNWPLVDECRSVRAFGSIRSNINHLLSVCVDADSSNQQHSSNDELRNKTYECLIFVFAYCDWIGIIYLHCCLFIIVGVNWWDRNWTLIYGTVGSSLYSELTMNPTLEVATYQLSIVCSNRIP